MDAVERHVTLPTDLEAAWDLLTRSEDLAGWLGAEVVLDPTTGAAGRVVEHDGTVRHLEVDEAVPGARLAWRWWTEGDAASRVEITLAPAEGGTRVTVVEAPMPGSPAPTASARASTGAAWSHRLLHLEALLLLAAAVRGVTPERAAVDAAEGAAGAVFAALADPTRRAVLRDVAEHGPVTATELADRHPVSRQAIAKHLAVLYDAGLVVPARAGRENRWTATPQPLEDASRWLREAGAAWDERLHRLAALASRAGPAPDGR